MSSILLDKSARRQAVTGSCEPAKRVHGSNQQRRVTAIRVPPFSCAWVYTFTNERFAAQAHSALHSKQSKDIKYSIVSLIIELPLVDGQRRVMICGFGMCLRVPYHNGADNVTDVSAITVQRLLRPQIP